MHCAICDQDGRAVSAIAICQRCGGAICRAHLEILCFPGAPGGMVGMCPPKRECVCQRCLERERALHTARRGKSGDRAADGLPDAETAIQAVEALLSGRRRAGRLWPAARWQRVRRWVEKRIAAKQTTEHARLSG